MTYDTRNRLPFYDPIPAGYGFEQLVIKSAVCPLVMHDRWVFSQHEVPTGGKRRVEDYDGNITMAVATSTKTDSRKVTFTCSRGRAEIGYRKTGLIGFAWVAYDAQGRLVDHGCELTQDMAEQWSLAALGMLWAHCPAGTQYPTTTEPTNLPGVAV